MRLILFDCSRESDYNHAYHERCLKRVIKEDLRKDKKAALNDKRVIEESRCIICYKQSQKI